MKRKLKPWVIPTFAVIVSLIVGAIVIGVMSSRNNDKNDITDNTTITMSTSGSVNQTENTLETVTVTETAKNEETSKPNDNNEETSKSNDNTTIKGYVNTFSGYTSLFAANGGNVTSKGSNFDKAGLNVEIVIEDDDQKIISAFKNNEIQFFAMTVNKMAMVSKEFEDCSIETVMPLLLDTSTGGDGIIADIAVKSIADLKNVKIGMAKESVSTAIPVWFLNQSGLSDEEVQEIVRNFVLFDSTQEAVEAFTRGEVGAVSTWDITGALEKENSHILVDTSTAEYLVIDGIVFRKDFVENHESEIIAMIDAILTTVDDIHNEQNVKEYYGAIRQSVPDFSEYSDKELTEEISLAKFLGYNENLEAFTVVEDIYKDFGKVWQQLGYKTGTAQIADDKYFEKLSAKWKESNDVPDKSDFNSTEANNAIDQEALISKHVKILFNGDSAEFKTGYEQTNKELINEFVKVAKIMNKTVIKISGHVNLGPGSSMWDEATQSYKIVPGFSSSEFAYMLSTMRAETVKEYMVSQGISENRIIIEGVGGDYPIDTNDTPEGQANNRSCEISFYKAGY